LDVVQCAGTVENSTTRNDNIGTKRGGFLNIRLRDATIDVEGDGAVRDQPPRLSNTPTRPRPEFGATFVPGTFREPLTWASCG